MEILITIVSLLLPLYNCKPFASSSVPMPAIAFPPPSLQWPHNKRIISFDELNQNYASLSLSAVGRNVIFPEEQYASANKIIPAQSELDLRHQDLDVSVDDSILSKPIGTYQYTDANGELHIVNYVNGYNGLKILNDYKPYERTSYVANTRHNTNFADETGNYDANYCLYVIHMKCFEESVN